MPLRVGGRTIAGPKTKLLVLPREPEDIVFRFTAVLDDADFYKICPEPLPKRQKNMKTGETTLLTTDPQYVAAWQEWNRVKNRWIFLQSIKPSQVEWQTVDENDPSTYGNWEQELRDAGLNMTEMNAVWQSFQDTNVLTTVMIDEARKRFLALEQAGPIISPSSQTDEQPSTQSSELAKDSA